jgi:DNA phosphorothioation-dependent restriction protein DptG
MSSGKLTIDVKCEICKKRFPLYPEVKDPKKRIETEEEAVEVIEKLIDFIEDYDHDETKWLDCADQPGCKTCIKKDHCVGIYEPLHKFLYILKFGVINKVCEKCMFGEAAEGGTTT